MSCQPAAGDEVCDVAGGAHGAEGAAADRDRRCQFQAQAAHADLLAVCPAGAVHGKLADREHRCGGQAGGAYWWADEQQA
jgi:hypothetical protein